MKEKRLLVIISLTFIFLMVTAWAGGVSAKENVTAPLLNGRTWVNMSQDQKTAYIWGVGDVIDLEQELMEIYPELKRDSFVAKSVESIGDVSINDIVSTVDSFYSKNPDQIDLTVIRVMWETMIKPKIKTGIAGKPLE